MWWNSNRSSTLLFIHKFDRDLRLPTTPKGSETSPYNPEGEWDSFLVISFDKKLGNFITTTIYVVNNATWISMNGTHQT